MLTYFPATLVYVRVRLGELGVGNLRAREEGVTAVEYALMVAIIALLLVGAFVALFNAVNDRYGDVGDCVASGPLPDACSPPPGP
ncbi:MAG TPA: Flp family type IVb pilin [Actinomycetes bacterium]|nr:Flp family type IVb pilin [Actinomycetes bacterium]